MRLALLFPSLRHDSPLAEDLRLTLLELDHDVVGPVDVLSLDVEVREKDLCAFMISSECVPLVSYLKAFSMGYRLASPSIHTLTLLDHPLYWRRMLERVGVPLGNSLVLDPGKDPERDPKVSVLGFPVRVSSSMPGHQEAVEAWDRQELCTAVAEIRLITQRVLLTKIPTGRALCFFTGISTRGPVLSKTAEISVEEEKLSKSLALHVTDILELAGPCRIDLVWEREQLYLGSVAHVTDLGRGSEAYSAAGGGYADFLSGVVEMAFLGD